MVGIGANLSLFVGKLPQKLYHTSCESIGVPPGNKINEDVPFVFIILSSVNKNSPFPLSRFQINPQKYPICPVDPAMSQMPQF